jgi:exodeoxyribonuclease VII large subunit
MEQLPLFSSKSLSVGDLNRLVRYLLEEDPALQDLWVTGEISGISRPASGHVYFTLKDSSATIRCVMWRDAAARAQLAKDGEAVEVHGHISLYEAGGQYQLYADAIQPAGQGLLFAEFQRLKEMLEREGLFDADQKIPLPAWPKKIVAVTSPSGAAWRDVQNVLARRFPLAELFLAPTPVQGEDAPVRIVSALRAADRAKADVILLVRGGGSIEDLWAFNDERVVRAVAALRTPVVTGVGHETDFTLVDFAADVRAPTPSAAAEIASPNRDELMDSVAALKARLDMAIFEWLAESRARLQSLAIHLRLIAPSARMQNLRQQLDEWSRRAQAAAQGSIQRARTAVESASRLLESVSPNAILGRGYALVWNEADQHLIRSVHQAPMDARLKIQLADGLLPVLVIGRGSGGKKEQST